LVQGSLGVPGDGWNIGAQSLWLPSGFSISLVGGGLKRPRFMAFDDAGNLLVAAAGAGAVYRYPGADGSIQPTPQPPAALLSGLDEPSNVALSSGYLYVGETSAISRYRYDAATGSVGAREVVVPDLPRGGHSTRTVLFGPDGWMYVSVGSSCNICDETDERRAAVLRFAPDGSGYERFAWGLRNAVGLAIQPGSGLVWATVNERDNQGNEIPPDLVTIVEEGQNFGWPGCQPPAARPQEPGRDCSGITPPTVGIQAHSAPLGLAFYTGHAFPPEYANDLFVVQHGSWNRQPPAAPKLLRIHFDGDQPVSAADFLTGWQDTDGNRWGRPVGVIVAPDGSLIVSDDQAGLLYRVSFG
jgi:glucose/arabinose dehydrogenase